MPSLIHPGPCGARRGATPKRRGRSLILALAAGLLGGCAGLISALVLVILSPAVWVAVLGHAEAIYPYDHPALFSMPLAFLVIVVVSRMDRSARAERERAAFDDQFVRAQTGLGAAAASSH